MQITLATSRYSLLTLFPAMVAFCSLPVSADVLELRQGGRLEGRVRLENNQGVQYYLVQLNSGALVGVPKGDVKAHLQSTPALEEYRTRAEQAGDSAEAHWELSKWCRANGLLDQWKRHAERVVVLDPEHGSARAALGQTKFSGVWMSKDQAQRQRGLIYKDGQWQIPEMAVLTEESKTSDASVRIWRTKIKRLRDRVNSSKFGAESLAELRAIADRDASTAIAELALDDNEPATMRELYLGLLANWETPEAINALIALGLSTDPLLRERALDLVKTKAPDRGAATYTALLKDANNTLVRRGARALAHMPRPDSVLPLIDALITKHKIVLQPASPGLSPTFTSDGGGGLNTGGKAKIVEQDFQNQDVLSALLSFDLGVNFQYDEDRWRAWYAERAEYPYNLRRDP